MYSGDPTGRGNMDRLLTLLILTGLGCDKFETEDTAGSGTVGPGPGTGTEMPTENGLPDWSWDLDTTGCEVQQATGVAGPGAASYFYGMYTGSGGQYTGYEEWHIFANDTWAASGGYDCIIKWSAVAIEGDPGPCAACDVNWSVQFTLNEAQSTCPDDLVEAAAASNSERYDVLRANGGDAQWFYGGSGEQFGTGSWNDGAMNFITPKSCRWF